jgi:hypothetical protein
VAGSVTGRIEGVDPRRAGPFVRLAYWFTRRRYGKLLQPVTVVAHHPWILSAAGAYELSLQRARRVDPRLKVLAGLKAATLVGCHF